MSAGGGASSGGSSSARAGASSGAGSTGQSVDCVAVCAHVKALCAENGAIDDVWLSACKSACDARVQVAPDTAELEQTCVMTAADCSAAIVCVASPH
ncbi:MAG TPA: hypothetical protein VER11_17730 [Polyangiaceae bacterium]|nr:hypothetical protein [Polyangiaceae bacterium]